MLAINIATWYKKVTNTGAGGGVAPGCGKNKKRRWLKCADQDASAVNAAKTADKENYRVPLRDKQLFFTSRLFGALIFNDLSS
jgi:hypothetical protein